MPNQYPNQYPDSGQYPGEPLNPSWIRTQWNRLTTVFGGGSADSNATTASARGSRKVPEPGVARKYMASQYIRTSNNALKSRMQLAQEKMLVWENKAYPLIERRLAEGFHPENFGRMRLFIHSSTNTLKSVVRDLSILYEEPARRRLTAKTSTQTSGSAGAEDDVSGSEPIDEQDLPQLPEATTTAPGATPNTPDPEVNALADLLPAQADDADEDTPFHRAMKASDWDTVLDTVEQLCRFMPVVWLRPMVSGPVNEDGELSSDTSTLGYVIYTPANADAMPDPDDPRRAIAWWYWADEIDDQGKLRKIIWYWTSEYSVKLDSDWKEIEDRVDNPSKRLPVTAFRRGVPINSYWCEGEGDDLYEATLELCILRTIQNARAKDSAFKQLAIMGADEKSVPADQVMGGPAPIYFPDENASAMVLDLEPQLQQFTDLCRDRAQEILHKYGMHVDVEQRGAPESGYARKLKMARILKENRRIRKHFAESEKDLYQLLAVTLQQNPIDQIGELDPSADLETDFAEPKFDEDPKTQSETDALDVKMGFRSIIDVLRDRNPDLTDVELLELAHRNKRINEVLMTSDQVKLIDLLAQSAATMKPAQPGQGGAPRPSSGQNPNGVDGQTSL